MQHKPSKLLHIPCPQSSTSSSGKAFRTGKKNMRDLPKLYTSWEHQLIQGTENI
jgi:hypothetical protein